MSRIDPPPRAPATSSESSGRITRYHIARPRPGIVETGGTEFEATEYAERRVGRARFWYAARDRIIGSTLSSRMLENERLSKTKALAVFSSDALSSTAYATQEILFVLILAGAGGIRHSLPIAVAICALLAVVVVSYRQTVRAYPGGGGAYIVAHENLGTTAGLIAAASLLIDYVLTVAVSVAAGMDALASLNPGLRPFAVEIAVGLVLLVAVINLRGMRESGTVFAIPTYAFVGLLGLAIVVALARVLANGENPLSAGTPREHLVATESIGIFFLLRAFANGCTALTGVEAISNGVQAFKAPSARNAAQTLTAMGLILGVLFLGVTVLARHFGFVPAADNTVPSQLGAEAFGDGTVLFVALQIMTAGILVLAANTAFADFPRLAAILARDGYMPRVFHARGNRLVFSYGIVMLALLAVALLIAFNATTTRLIPLYALGVFLSFTLSQGGMVLHWLHAKGEGWRRAAVVNGLGGTVTFIVLAIILHAKFAEGAWVIVLLIPILATVAGLIGRFYRQVARALHIPEGAVLDVVPRGAAAGRVVVPIDDINLASAMALASACERSNDVVAVHVMVDADEPSTVAHRWPTHFPNVPLVVIDSPYRNVADPIAVYVREQLKAPPHDVTLLVPEVVRKGWASGILLNRNLRKLRGSLRGTRHVRIESFRFDVAPLAREKGRG